MATKPAWIIDMEGIATKVLAEILTEIDLEPIEIKNHAHFRRILQEGKVKLETISLANGMSSGRLSVGMVRSIKKANTTGVYLAAEGDDSRGSFLDYGKASEWEFEGDIAKNIKFGYSYKLLKG